MTSSTPAAGTDTTAIPQQRVRTDVRAGGLFLAIVIGGHLLWQASDAGILSAIGAR